MDSLLAHFSGLCILNGNICCLDTENRIFSLLKYCAPNKCQMYHVEF